MVGWIGSNCRSELALMVDLNVGELACPEVGGGVFIPLQEICPLHRNSTPDISGPQTGSSGEGRIFPPKVPVYLSIPSASFCLLDLVKNLRTGYIRPQGRKFRWGRIFPPKVPVHKMQSSGSSCFRSLDKTERAGYIRGAHRIYPVGAGYFR